MLKTIRIRLPGKWSDGWLYKEHLLLWSRTGKIHVTALSDLARRIRQETSPAISVATDFLVFRNDWKAGEQLRRLRTIPEFDRILFSELSNQSDPTSVSLDSFQLSESEHEATPGVLLDSAVYADRIYVGSTAGLFETLFSPSEPERVNPVVQRLEHRIASLSVKYSAVNGSANENGLWFAPVIFGDGWYAEDRAAFRQIAELSRDNSFAAQHLLNYADGAFPTFLRAETVRQRTNENAEYPETQIVGYQQQRDIRHAATAAMVHSRKVSLAEHDVQLAVTLGGQGANSTIQDDSAAAQVLGNSDFRLLILWQDDLHVLDISAYQGKDIEIRPDRRFGIRRRSGIAPDSILKTYAVASGFIVEFFDHIALVTSAGSHVIFNGEAARIRTFNHSRRYKDAVLVVEDDCVSLIGFVEVPE